MGVRRVSCAIDPQTSDPSTALSTGLRISGGPEFWNSAQVRSKTVIASHRRHSNRYSDRKHAARPADGQSPTQNCLAC